MPAAWFTPLVVLLAATAASAAPAREAEKPARQVRFAVQITRTDAADARAAAGAAQVLGLPVITTLDKNTGSIAVSGTDLSYSLSLSPGVEAGNNVALLWNLQLSGRGLPGATAVTMTGASRVAAGKAEPVAEITLKDPKTGRHSTFRVLVTTTVVEATGRAGSVSGSP
uniref:CHRD domain-containing protein n=1 Tax=uncultured Armatimonadetes bacterium TaxID=157466 RepID=A0A6J4K108_9BACT|nr:hypothetical protein AVDCRST_MAG63-4468 [uncultured Armatimonadetes bacterium]